MAGQVAGDRLQEFTVEGRDFVWLDFSGFRELAEYQALTAMAEEAIAKYPEKSLLTIADIHGVGFNAEVQRLMAKHMVANGPHVRHTVVIGADTIRRLALTSIFVLSRRKNVVILDTKEEAIAWLLKQP